MDIFRYAIYDGSGYRFDERDGHQDDRGEWVAYIDYEEALRELRERVSAERVAADSIIAAAGASAGALGSLMTLLGEARAETSAWLGGVA